MAFLVAPLAPLTLTGMNKRSRQAQTGLTGPNRLKVAFACHFAVARLDSDAWLSRKALRSNTRESPHLPPDPILPSFDPPLPPLAKLPLQTASPKRSVVTVSLGDTLTSIDPPNGALECRECCNYGSIQQNGNRNLIIIHVCPCRLGSISGA